MLSDKRREALKSIADRHQIDIRWPEHASSELDGLPDAAFKRFLTEVVEPKLTQLEAKQVSLLIIQRWLQPPK